jgi:hypothetical protein
MSFNMTVPNYCDLPEPVPGFRVSWEFFNQLSASSRKTEKDELGTVRLHLSQVVLDLSDETSAQLFDF